MNGIPAVKSYCQTWVAGWNRFWFTPADPAILGVLRVLAGAIIFYTHLAWGRELATFFGSQSIIPADYRAQLVDSVSYMWSHFDWLPSDGWLWPVHLFALAVIFCFTIGLWTRVTGILTALLVISYANRATGAQFGLDQINGFLALYLGFGPAGRFLSVDAWLRRRKSRSRALAASTETTVGANIAIRLIQVHLCVVYLFAGLGKLQGDTWWTGLALWGAVANLEYQTIDLTWLAGHLALVNLLTFSTLAWEVCYPFLVWHRLTRPIMIAVAIVVHLGIGMAMGMLTFGMIMIVANFAFISSDWVRNRFDFGEPSARASSA